MGKEIRLRRRPIGRRRLIMTIMNAVIMAIMNAVIMIIINAVIMMMINAVMMMIMISDNGNNKDNDDISN